MHDDEFTNEQNVPETTPIADATAKAQWSENDRLNANKLSITAAAKKLGIGETTMRRLVRRGEIPCIRYGSKYLFLECDLLAYQQSHYGRIQQPEVPAAHLHHAPPDYLKNSPHLKSILAKQAKREAA